MGRWTRRSDLTVDDLGSELVLFDERSGAYHVLNDTARQIWMLLDAGHEGAELMERFVSLYPGVDRERLEQDLARTITELGGLGLLEGPSMAASA